MKKLLLFLFPNIIKSIINDVNGLFCTYCGKSHSNLTSSFCSDVCKEAVMELNCQDHIEEDWLDSMSEEEIFSLQQAEQLS